MKKFEFRATGVVYGVWTGETREAAQEVFARELGYRSWAAMVGLDIEVEELEEDD